MAEVGDWPAKAPAFWELVELGAIDMRVWAIEFSPKVQTGQAPTGRETPTSWKACIIFASPARPMVVALRKTAREAEEDVKRGFWQTYSKRPHKYPPPDKPLDFPGLSNKALKKALPHAGVGPGTPDEDEDGMDLI